MTNNRVCVVGAVNADLVIHVSPLTSVKGYGTSDDFRVQAGGKGLNTALSMAALAPDQVGFVGKVGDDIFGSFIEESIANSNLRSFHLPKMAGEKTGVGHVRVRPDGEYDTVVFAGANESLCTADIEMFVETFTAVGFFATNLEAPVSWLTDMRERFPSARLCVNLSPINNRVDVALSVADLIVLNDAEARSLTHTSPDESDEKLLAELRELTTADIVITRGSDGAVALTTSGQVFHVSAYPVEVVTTVGAGDSFFAALCVAIAGGASFEEALDFASRAGAAVAASEENFITHRNAVELALPV